MKNILVLTTLLSILFSCSSDDSNTESPENLGQESYRLIILGGPLDGNTYDFSSSYVVESDLGYDYEVSSSEDWINDSPLGWRTELFALVLDEGEETTISSNSSSFIIRDTVNNLSYSSNFMTVRILRKFIPQGEDFGPNDYAYDIYLEANLGTGNGDGINFWIELEIENIVFYDCESCIGN